VARWDACFETFAMTVTASRGVCTSKDRACGYEYFALALLLSPMRAHVLDESALTLYLPSNGKEQFHSLSVMPRLLAVMGRNGRR